MKTLKTIFLIFTCFVLIIGCSKDETLVNEPGEMTLKNASLAPVFAVEPNGVDDTENLKNAFADAMNAGPGSVVQLAEGEFYIDLVEIRDFVGVLNGEGKNKTVVTTIEHPNFDEVNSQNLYPVLLKFLGGDVSVKGITFRTQPESTDWFEGLIAFLGWSEVYEPANRYIKSTVDNIAVIAPNQNVGYGLMTGSDSKGMAEGIPLSNIDICITNSYFSNCAWYGACIMMIKVGNIKVGTKNNGNVFGNNPYVGLGIWHNISVKISVQDNSFTCRNAWCGLELHSSPWPGNLKQYPQTFASVANIEQNDFDVTGCKGAMIINDNRRVYFPDESPMLVQIKNNNIKTDETNTSGIRCVSLYGAVIRNNTFAGGGIDGVNIRRQAGVYNENGLILGNNFSNASYSQATVIFNKGTRNWTIVGGNLGESVLDYGENNIINGFNNQSSEVPLGQTIVDNLEEMRGPLHDLKEN